MAVLPPLRVIRSEAITPRMRRVTVGGEALRALEPLAPAQHVRLLLPPDGTDDVVLPRREDGVLVPAPDGPRPVARSMTVRHVDRRRGELDIDVALHGDTAGTRWASTAVPGSTVGVVGPGGGYVPPAADVHLLAGDETALPAMATIAEALPASASVQILAEVTDADDEQPVGGRPVQWVHRARGESLEQAVRAWAWPAGGTVAAWIAGEGHSVRGLRAYLRGERGLDQHSCHAIRYWTRGRTQEDSDATFGAARAEAARRGIELRTTQDVHEMSYELMTGPLPVHPPRG